MNLGKLKRGVNNMTAHVNVTAKSESEAISKAIARGLDCSVVGVYCTSEHPSQEAYNLPINKQFRVTMTINQNVEGY